MKQKEARTSAKDLNKEYPQRQFIASTVPLNAWSGRERGWAVYEVIGGKLAWFRGTE